MKLETIQPSFVAGEFAPTLFGRTRIAQYQNACALLENFLIRPYGSAISTPGTEFINDAKYTTVNTSSNIILSLDFEGDFVDSSTYNHVATNSGATIDVSTPLNGSGSGVFTPGHFLSYPWSSEFDIIQTIDIFISFRVKFNALPANGKQSLIFTIWDYPVFDQGNLIFKIYKDGALKAGLEWKNTNINGTTCFWPINITTGVNYLFEYKRESEVSSLKIDGVTQTLGSGNTGINPGGIGMDSNTVIWISSPILGGTDIQSDMELDDFIFIIGESEIITGDRVYGKSRLIPFIFARDDAYVIEVGSGYFRFYTDGAVVTQ